MKKLMILLSLVLINNICFSQDTIFNFNLNNNARQWWVEHDTNSRGFFYKNIIINPGKALRFCGDTISMNGGGWLNSSRVSNWNTAHSLVTDTINKTMTVKRASDSIASIKNDINGKVPTSRVLTINGIPFDLSSNRSWSNVGVEIPSQAGNSGKVLGTNGSSASWITPGNGTVTSVGLSMPSAFTVTNSPITTTGSISVSGAGTSSQVIDGTGALKTISIATAYSSGTAYTLTTSSSKVDFGTTDPAITIPAAGTYLIYTNLKIEYSGLTTALNACSFKLRRTNNTASDITNATTTFNVPAVTLLTGTGGDVDIPAIIYTTSNNNDTVELWGNRSGGLTVGAINVGEASIVAIRIY